MNVRSLCTMTQPAVINTSAWYTGWYSLIKKHGWLHALFSWMIIYCSMSALHSNLKQIPLNSLDLYKQSICILIVRHIDYSHWWILQHKQEAAQPVASDVPLIAYGKVSKIPHRFSLSYLKYFVLFTQWYPCQAWDVHNTRDGFT